MLFAFDILKQAKFVSLRQQPEAVLTPVSHRWSCRRRQWKCLLIKVPNVNEPLGVADTQSRGSLLRNNASLKPVEHLQIFNPSTTFISRCITSPQN